MWLPLLGLLLGLVVGLSVAPVVPPEYSRYTAVAILATLDAILGAARADLNQTYDSRIFWSGFITNALLAILLTYLGDRLGVDLFLAAVVAFGVRLFTNLAIIRRHFL
ncbi:MAG: small basic family protein [Chloroflexi bacterium]|nr:small basic family protein [Chloroflexota bacterium]